MDHDFRDSPRPDRRRAIFGRLFHGPPEVTRRPSRPWRRSEPVTRILDELPQQHLPQRPLAVGQHPFLERREPGLFRRGSVLGLEQHPARGEDRAPRGFRCVPSAHGSRAFFSRHDLYAGDLITRGRHTRAHWAWPFSCCIPSAQRLDVVRERGQVEQLRDRIYHLPRPAAFNYQWGFDPGCSGRRRSTCTCPAPPGSRPIDRI